MNETVKTTVRTILYGAIDGAKAGAAATVPMGATLRLGLMATDTSQRVPFSAVMKSIERKVGVHVDEPVHDAAAWAGHVASGAAFGALFGAATSLLPAQARSPAKDAAWGAVFGLGLWAASYLGWLPAPGVLRFAKRGPAALNATNIAAHLVWGGATGARLARTPTA